MTFWLIYDIVTNVNLSEKLGNPSKFLIGVIKDGSELCHVQLKMNKKYQRPPPQIKNYNLKYFFLIFFHNFLNGVGGIFFSFFCRCFNRLIRKVSRSCMRARLRETQAITCTVKKKKI